MPDITITLTQAEYDSMTVMSVTPEEWAIHAVKNKASAMMNKLVTDHSDKQAEKITTAEKETIVLGIDLAVEKIKRHGPKK